MRKKIYLILCIVMMIFLCSCATPTKLNNGENNLNAGIEEYTESIKVAEIEKEIEQPDLTQIRSICKLATLECYYHNVAKSVKEAGTGITHLGEKDRKFWTEYNGVAKIGVDMSRGSMDVKGTEITIYIPEAEILSIKPNSESVAVPIADTDSANSNPIEAEDVTEAINIAQEDIVAKIQNDSSLLVNAQDRAKKLIENYINQLGEISGVKFTIKWETIHNSSSLAEEN